VAIEHNEGVDLDNTGSFRRFKIGSGGSSILDLYMNIVPLGMLSSGQNK
jgi:hypothetical protein